jgi:hypothetical protein
VPYATSYGKFVKVIPLTLVVANSSENGHIAFNGRELKKVGAICAHESSYGSDTGHPHVVEDDVATDCAERGIKAEINENIIKEMAAINENKIELRIGSCEVCGDAARAILDEAEAGIRPCGGGVGIGMSKTNTMPMGMLIRIDSSMVAGPIPGNGGKEIERAVAIGQADLKSRFGLD